MLFLTLACVAPSEPPFGKGSMGADDSGDSAANADDSSSDSGEDTGDMPPPDDLLRDDFDALDDVVWGIGDWTLGDTALVQRNVSAHDGLLDLRHRGSTDAGWTGGEIYSMDEYSSGVWTARVTAPTDPGTVCAFFFYGWTDDANGGETNEIDVELLAGKAMVGTYAGWHESDGYETSATREWQWVDGDATGTHDYQIDWTADVVTFSVDGAPAASFSTAVPAGDLALHFNHWTTDAWDDVGGPPAANDLHCLVDWVAGG